MMKKVLKNQKGLTLIELLAVIVILGIIAAIAVPAIGNVLENTKKDAHLANAQEIKNAARLYITTENQTVPDGATGLTIKLSKLIADNYMDAISDPSNSGNVYNDDTTTVKILNNSGVLSYYVTVVSKHATPKTYIDGSVELTSVTRTDVDID